MNEKKIFDAITNVQDELIDEARVMKLKRKTNKWKKWTAIAAGVMILVIGGTFLGEDERFSGEALLNVIYPTAYAFGDTDARMNISQNNPVDDSFLESIKKFSYTTAVEIINEKGENINYSPISLYYALALAASGADGATAGEIFSLLGVSDRQLLSKQCGNLYRQIYKDNEIGKLKIANSIWMDNKIRGRKVLFKENFIQNAVENFYASSHIVDFNSKDAGEAISKWISENTNDTISPSMEVDKNQILSIINTIYFYDQWVTSFEKNKTRNDTFYLSDGNEVSCDFMNGCYSGGFSKGEGYTRASLPLKNAGEMLFVLPDEGVSPYELIDSPEQMREIFEGESKYYGEIIWQIPKFKFGSKLNLKDNLKALGVSTAFLNTADFSGITNHELGISVIEQESSISIDENGVEASAFTIISYESAMEPKDKANMILNRPFLYGITDSNGILLFVGVCENPIG